MTDDRPRNIANDMLDAIETATKKWTRQKKAEERHPSLVRYRTSRMTKVSRVTQKDAAWQIMEEAYMAASANDTLPAKARQVFYQARPQIMAMTEDRPLDDNYFTQTLLPDYIEEHGCDDWNVIYDARGHFEEPHTNRRIGCGTLEVDNYLAATREPSIIPPEFSDAGVDIIGPAGGFSGVVYIEKEGFDALFKAVDLANRYDLLIISNKGLSCSFPTRRRSFGNKGPPTGARLKFPILERESNTQRAFSVRLGSLKRGLASGSSALTDALCCPFTLVPTKPARTPRPI
jgi:hypothetical protein